MRTDINDGSYVLQHSLTKKEIISMKLTDSMFKALAAFEHKGSAAGQLQMVFKEGTGNIIFPSIGPNQGQNFSFKTSVLTDSDQCYHHRHQGSHKEEMCSIGHISHRLQINGNGDSFQKIKGDFQTAKKQEQSSTTKALDFGRSSMSKKVVKGKKSQHNSEQQQPNNGFVQNMQTNFAPAKRTASPVGAPGEYTGMRNWTKPKVLSSLGMNPANSTTSNERSELTLADKICHILMIRPHKVIEVVERLRKMYPSSGVDQPLVMKECQTVATSKQESNGSREWSLRPEFLSKVSIEWSGYTEAEKMQVKRRKKEMSLSGKLKAAELSSSKARAKSPDNNNNNYGSQLLPSGDGAGDIDYAPKKTKRVARTGNDDVAAAPTVAPPPAVALPPPSMMPPSLSQQQQATDDSDDFDDDHAASHHRLIECGSVITDAHLPKTVSDAAAVMRDSGGYCNKTVTSPMTYSQQPPVKQRKKQPESKLKNKPKKQSHHGNLSSSSSSMSSTSPSSSRKRRGNAADHNTSNSCKPTADATASVKQQRMRKELNQSVVSTPSDSPSTPNDSEKDGMREESFMKKYSAILDDHMKNKYMKLGKDVNSKYLVLQRKLLDYSKPAKRYYDKLAYEKNPDKRAKLTLCLNQIVASVEKKSEYIADKAQYDLYGFQLEHLHNRLSEYHQRSHNTSMLGTKTKYYAVDNVSEKNPILARCNKKLSEQTGMSLR